MTPALGSQEEMAFLGGTSRGGHAPRASMAVSREDALTPSDPATFLQPGVLILQVSGGCCSCARKRSERLLPRPGGERRSPGG